MHQCLLDFYTTQFFMSTSVSIECISWLMRVLIIMIHGGNLKLVTCMLPILHKEALLLIVPVSDHIGSIIRE